jgi:hypothetical protein
MDSERKGEKERKKREIERQKETGREKQNRESIELTISEQRK